MDLPVGIGHLLAPLFDALPVEKAMSALVVRHGAPRELVRLVETVAAAPEFAQMRATCSGLWLYIDGLAQSHTISQSIPSRTGSAWHAIMHRREGDFSNSHYWFRKAGTHPAFQDLKGYDSHDLVHAVEAAGENAPPELVDLQRREWCALFAWCAENEHKRVLSDTE